MIPEVEQQLARRTNTYKGVQVNNQDVSILMYADDLCLIAEESDFQAMYGLGTASSTSVAVLPEQMAMHWQAWHLRKGLCMALPCLAYEKPCKEEGCWTGDIPQHPDCGLAPFEVPPDI